MEKKKNNLWVLILVALLSSCGNSHQSKSEATLQQNIAKAYGIENFNRANKLSYTFNVKRGTTTTSRSWVWQPKKNIVQYKSATENIIYRRDTIQAAAMKKIDGMFINDQYWLLYPFHIIWDAGTTQTIEENMAAPISKLNSKKLTVQYGADGGYTPGDAYDLYVDDKFMVKEWSFRKGGVTQPSLTASWEDVKELVGIKFTTQFKNDSGFNLFFTEIVVE